MLDIAHSEINSADPVPVELMAIMMIVIIVIAIMAILSSQNE
jgi:hypothetical protein